MLIDLRSATLPELVDAIFDHEVAPRPERDPWYYDYEVDFAVEPVRQMILLADLFRHAATALARFSPGQVGQGFWCMLGGVHMEHFTGHIWNPDIPFALRAAVIDSIYDLYDGLIASAPFEPIDFGSPDWPARRFQTIDYMIPDLVLTAWHREDADDRVRVREAFLELFERLLDHPAPVARYAALHGLGHLEHDGRAAIIDAYLDAHPDITADVRTYALAARRGEVL
jgi:hypothetical protein